MNKIGIGIDYSNICKDYNTSYLDRDNTDPATKKCMKQVMTWSKAFLSDLLEEFGYGMFHLHSDTPVGIDEISSKRFHFYSLEKEITLQEYVLQKAYVAYDSLHAWSLQEDAGVLIQNDEDGAGIYLYVEKGSKEEAWIREKLTKFSLDEVDFPTK